MKACPTTSFGGIFRAARASGCRRFLLAGTLVLSAAMPLLPDEVGPEAVRLMVRVFRVPKQQSFESALLDAKGRSITIQACGDVTTAFPRAMIFFPTELAAAASEGAIADAILDRVPVWSGGMAVRSLGLDELKTMDLALSKGKPEARADFEEGRGEGRTSRYDVRAELLSSNESRVLVRLRFDAGWSAQAGSLGVGMSEDVVSAPFELPESRLCLIGGRSQGTVYWLAVCAAPREAVAIPGKQN